MASSFNTMGSTGGQNPFYHPAPVAPRYQVQSASTPPKPYVGTGSSNGFGGIPYAPTVGVPNAPQKGLLDQHDTSNQQVVSKTDSQGNTVKFAPSDNNNSSTTSKNNSSTGTSTVGTPVQNAQNVLNASQGNTAGQGAANAAALYEILGNNAGLMPFSGRQQGLNQSFADLTRPQSTGNLAGEEGLFNTQNAIFQNAANTSASQAIANKNIATQGATSVLNAGLPRQQGYVNLNPFNPDTTGGGGGASAAAGMGAQIESGAKSVGDYTDQINLTDKSTKTLDNLSSQIIPNMGTTGFNPENTPIGNQSFQQYFANSSPAASAGLKEGLSEVKNQISNVISSATGLTPTGVTEAVGTIDLTTLSPLQLNDFLLYIKGYAASNIKAAQDEIARINSGQPADVNFGPIPAPNPNGLGISAAATGATLAQGLVNKILDEAGNVVAGAAAGSAASVFK